MSAFGVGLWVFAMLVLGAYSVAVIGCLIDRRPLSMRTALVLPIAEAVSLLRQESLSPRGNDSVLFNSAPIVAVAAVSLAALVIPFGPNLIGLDTPIGLFLFIVVLGPFVIAMMNAGWSSNSKAGLFGTFRAAAHLISYEVPLGFAAIGPAMAAGSLATTRIVEMQSGLWYALWQPLGVAIYLIAALVMTYRRPFDIAQAGSELQAGVLSEYSGIRLLLFKLALHAIFFLLMCMGVVLFFGGWYGPLLPAPAWFLIKTFLLTAAVLWLASFAPRVRHDQMLALAWKVLLPASLLNVGLVGIIILEGLFT